MDGPPSNLTTYYPELEACLQDSDEALGLVILDILKAFTRTAAETRISTSLSVHVILSQWVMPTRVDAFILKTKFDQKVEDAWRWLLEEKLIKPLPGDNGRHGLIAISELGHATTRDQKALLDANRALPEALLHPRILARIRGDFRQGLYGKAVQDAFKPVEAETRKAAGLEEFVSGEDVFKRAFGRGSRLFASISKPQDMTQFFCVSYRIHRHRPSHGNPVIEPHTAARQIMLASHLLFMLDEVRSESVMT